MDERYGFEEMNRVIVFLVFLIACSQVPQVSNESFVEFNNSKFFVEIADEPNEWQKGLMFVESLPKNEGMLFIFNDSSPRTFWMKNTLIPLDMIFVDENFVVVDVKENVPPCKVDPCDTYPSEKASMFVVELNAGSVKENNVSVGQIMRMTR